MPAALLDPTQPSAYVPSENQSFEDSGCVILPSGSVLMAPVLPNNNGDTLIYSPTTNTWTAGGSYLSTTQNEATWVKLADNSILTIDPFGMY